MDLAYRGMRNAVLTDALPMRHDFMDDPQGNTEPEMDPCILCYTDRSGDRLMLYCCKYSTFTWIGIVMPARGNRPGMTVFPIIGQSCRNIIGHDR